MFENSIYAVLSPEGFGSLFLERWYCVMEAAELMKITSHELLNMEIVDKVIPCAGFSNGELLASSGWITGRVKGFGVFYLSKSFAKRYQR